MRGVVGFIFGGLEMERGFSCGDRAEGLGLGWGEGGRTVVFVWRVVLCF